jgi:cell division protein FtsI (penicillin-binding protein 3)
MLLFGLIIVGKIIYLQFFNAKEWLEQEKVISIKNQVIEPYRGDILDCYGRLLATSIPYYEVHLDLSYETIPTELFNSTIDSLALSLAKYFKDKPKSEYKRILQSARRENKRYFLFKKNITYLQLKEIRKFPLFRLGKNKGGFIPVQEYSRKQPYIDLATRTVGYVSRSDAGSIVGIEGSFDAELKGTTGMMIIRKIAGGYWMPVSDENEVEPQDGCDIVTTIDVELQDVATTALRTQLLKNNAHHGCVILMEVSTGEIKAISNLGLDKDGEYKELYNYAIGESTEPGSTFKLPVLMSCFEDGYISLNDSINTGKGSVQFYDKIIHDSHEEGYGKIPVYRVFELSSNVGCAMIADKCYKGRERKFVDRLYSFNLNQKLDLDIRGEAEPEIKYPGDKFWSGISLPMMAHGYELKMAPIHILTFYNAVANNGKMVKPRFVKEIRSHGMILKKFDTEIINPSICSNATIRMARKMLEGVVENGTAVNLKNTHLKIAGKTGTAQIAKEKLGYRSESRISYQASFCGYFPAENPKYSCIIVINSPSNSVYYGNVVAGPVFKEIAEKVYSSEMGAIKVCSSGSLQKDAPYSKGGEKENLINAFGELGIEYRNSGESRKAEWISTMRDSDFVKVAPRKMIKNLIPDVTGMGMQDALYLLENEGLRVVFSGYGTVRSQSLTPGSVADNGKIIYLSLTN